MSDKGNVPINKYFEELAIRLRQIHIDCGTMEDEQKPILLAGETIGAVLPGGEMRIKKEFVDEPTASDLIDRAGRVAAEVSEYMNLMDLHHSYRYPVWMNRITSWRSSTALYWAAWRASTASSLPHGCRTMTALAYRWATILAVITPEPSRTLPSAADWSTGKSFLPQSSLQQSTVAALENWMRVSA